MAKYVDGFVLVVPKSKTAQYKKMAMEGKEMWMKAGALSYFECMGDDLEPKDMGSGMKPLDFRKMAKAKTNENVWFSFVTYKSRKHRDAVNKKLMAEMDKMKDQYKDIKMPFDIKKMAYGGFSVEVEG